MGRTGFSGESEGGSASKNPHHSLPDVLKEAMFQVMSSDPIELAKHRLQVVLAVKGDPANW